jgi:hypothetical protein
MSLFCPQIKPKRDAFIQVKSESVHLGTLLYAVKKKKGTDSQLNYSKTNEQLILVKEMKIGNFVISEWTNNLSLRNENL